MPPSATTSGIPERVREDIIRLASANPRVEKVVLYGSRARGDADERSDIDLCVVASEAEHSDLSRLFLDLREGMHTLLFVDVVWWEEAEDRLRAQIERDGKIIYERRTDANPAGGDGAGIGPPGGGTGAPEPR